MKIDFNIKEILTLPILIWAALSLSSSVLLFLPNSFLKQIFILDFRDKYGFIIGAVFILSFSILVVNLVYSSLKSWGNLKAKKKFYADAETRLRKLNDYQKTIIYVLYEEDNHTMPLPLHDGAVMELNQKLMIEKATNQYMVNDLNNAHFPYFLQPWVVDELLSKPTLLLEFSEAFERQYQKETNHSRF